VLRLPRIVGVDELRKVSFYDYQALTQCRLKGCLRHLRLVGSLPSAIPSKHALLGRFHHELMRHAVTISSCHELEQQIEIEVRALQEEVARWPHLRGSGAVSGWERVNASSVVAMSTFAARRRGTGSAMVGAECTLHSADGMRSGRLDYYEIVGDTARLKEYKAGDIREHSGEVIEAHQQQLLFYAGLLFDRYRIERVLAQLQSLNGDQAEREINLAGARDFSQRVIGAIVAANEQVRSIQSTDELAHPSALACQDCELRPLCGAYKRTQLTLGLVGEHYVLEARVIKHVHSASGRLVELALEEPTTTGGSRTHTRGINVPAESAAGVSEGMIIVLSDLRPHAGTLCWGKQSRIFLLE
jgi:hypothetical protein